MAGAAKRMLVGAVLGLSVCLPTCALDINRDPANNDYLLGRGIDLPVQVRRKAFTPGSRRANFTYAHGVSDVTVHEGTLTFTLVDDKATLGWGDYLGQQPVAEIEDMWQEENAVQLQVRQLAGPSQWTARLWRDGGRLEATTSVALEGTGWQRLDFKPLRCNGANPDGLELTIEGPKGARVELTQITLLQRAFEGYCRTEIVVPEGGIWRAVANVGSANYRNWFGRSEIVSELHINGQIVQRGCANHLYHTDAVDIASCLRPGRNCIAFYGRRIGAPPLLYLQARIIMETGSVVTVATGEEWRQHPQAGDGWDQPGFDDSAWKPAKRGSLPWLESRGAAQQVGIPAYSGRLVLRHPERQDLFYTDTSDVIAEVHVPAGLAAEEPTLSYAFGQADPGGNCRLIKEGTQARFSAREGSLVYRSDPAGSHRHFRAADEALRLRPDQLG